MAEANVTKQLPPEVLTKIFEHCTNLNQLVNIVDVCKLARDVAIREYNRSGNDLVIRRPEDISDLVSLLGKPVSFTKLRIVWDVPSDVDCSSESLDALANATSLTHLQSFTFTYNDEDDGGFDEYDEVLAAFLTLLTQTSTDTLTHLKLIIEGSGLSGKIVEIIDACQYLSHLVLNGCNLQGDGQRCVDIISTLTHLELLDLRDISAGGLTFDLSFIAAVKRGCPNISNNIMIGELRVTPSDDMNMLQFVSHVDKLYIVEFDTDQLTTLVSSLNERVSQLSVDRLWVTPCDDHLTDDILLSLVQCLRGLKMINASGCDQLTNEGVVSVIASSPQLDGIDISYINNIDTGILPLLDHVVTNKDMHINAFGTKLSEPLATGDSQLYTGQNRNICLEY